MAKLRRGMPPAYGVGSSAREPSFRSLLVRWSLECLDLRAQHRAEARSFAELHRRHLLALEKLPIEVCRIRVARLGSDQLDRLTYADDLVILCRKGKADETLLRLREIMGKLKLTVNEEKTRIRKIPDEQFDFLGYTFGRLYSKTTGKARLGLWLSKKSIRRMVEKVHDLTDRMTGWQETTEKVEQLNRALRG